MMKKPLILLLSLFLFASCEEQLIELAQNSNLDLEEKSTFSIASCSVIGDSISPSEVTNQAKEGTCSLALEKGDVKEPISKHEVSPISDSEEVADVKKVSMRVKRIASYNYDVNYLPRDNKFSGIDSCKVGNFVISFNYTKDASNPSCSLLDCRVTRSPACATELTKKPVEEIHDEKPLTRKVSN